MFKKGVSDRCLVLHHLVMKLDDLSLFLVGEVIQFSLRVPDERAAKSSCEQRPSADASDDRALISLTRNLVDIAVF
ncbi:hypothetical protein VXL47_12280 [Phaeobacter sp. JH20_30]|uniref:hypothetical protein n=1 Tax=unclassified Phaeobacter TaxID=2621772 RepID=UPI003A8A26A4